MSSILEKGHTIPVLDYGYVCYINSMGEGIHDILSAARMSTGNPTGVDRAKDLATLSHLYRYKHMTPFEMAELVIEVQVPIFVAREWHRHRTQCLSGNTQVYFELPARARSGKRGVYKLTLKELWERWQPTQSVKRPNRQKNPFYKRERVQKMLVRCLNEETGAFITTRILDVIQSGIKQVFKVTTEDGKSITATLAHRFLFADGWKTLADGAGVTVHGNLVAWNKEAALQTNGVFATAHEPWNKGKTYSTGHTITEEHKQAIREARSGEKSNFWKGGVSSDRANIGRWTREQASKVHAKFNHTCQMCATQGGQLEAHHIIPVWADEAKALDFNNLVTLCKTCHRGITGQELNYAPRFTGQPIMADYSSKAPKMGAQGKPKLVAKLSKIVDITYVGEEMCYDLSVEGPFHNFVGDGIVTHNSFNEYSGRYAEMLEITYLPAVERIRPQSQTNKQGTSNETFDPVLAKMIQSNMAAEQTNVKDAYKGYLEAGVAREVARINVPLSQYTRFRAKANLRNWLHFLSLRMAPEAQWEIREYARIVGDEIVKPLWPEVWDLFEEFTLYATTLSRTETQAIQAYMNTLKDLKQLLKARPEGADSGIFCQIFGGQAERLLLQVEEQSKGFEALLGPTRTREFKNKIWDR